MLKNIYRDLGGDSRIQSYEYDDSSITVQFLEGLRSGYTIYTYTDVSVGDLALQGMKQLADSGEGLNEYINENVRKRYASRR